MGRAWGAGVFSVLVFTPLIAMWYRGRELSRPKSFTKKVEIIAAFCLLLAENHFLFWTSYPQYFGISVIFFLPAVLIWFALRLHPRWLTLALVLTSFQGIAGSILAHPSVVALNEQLISDEVYIGLIAAIFLIFVAVVEERRAAYKQLEKAYQSTSAADSAKSEFIAILAHELRNPLAPIVSSLELLKLQPQTIESVEALESAETHTLMLRRLLDDLLDTVRLTKKKFNLQKEILSMQEVIALSLESARDFIRSRGHNLTVSVPDEPVMLNADPVRVRQMITNLLNNAAKYTNPGGKIELVLQREEDNAVIRVTDNGIGIEAEALPHLFDSFWQADSARERNSGLGIGLSLTKRLIEMHDGRIEVRSQGLGRGSTFSVYLPALSGESPAPVNRKVQKKGTVLSRRILVVDDNRAAADGMQKLLVHHGHHVETAYSGERALETSGSFAPDVILLDLGLPDIDGYEVARRIRSGGWGGVIVALTGYGQEGDRLQSGQAGFNHHLVKPVGAADILGLLAGS